MEYLRKEYHKAICKNIIRLSKYQKGEYPNFSDKGSKASKLFALGILKYASLK